MSRLAATGVIVTYLGLLAGGVVAHTLSVGTSSHPAMYFFVWDMFCGWSAQETRYHMLAEGESGQFYALSPAPWGDFCPFDGLGRHNYDPHGNNLRTLAMNTLRHTQHEPIARVLMVEENWHKKFNLSEELWSWRYDEPKDPHSYFWTLQTLSGEGEVLTHRQNWWAERQAVALMSNPRLVRESQQNRPMFAIDPAQRALSWVEPPAQRD